MANMKPIPTEMTYGESLGPAMAITDQQEADDYFEWLVTYHMQFVPTREEAERITRVNLGYYSGYYDHVTQLRVQRLFKCVHPIFGAIPEGDE